MRRILALACVLGISLLAGCKGETSNKRQIAVIPKGTTHEHWKGVEAGARKAGQELGVDILWKGPIKEDDRAGQIQIVEQFVTDGVHGIILAPLDDKALLPVQLDGIGEIGDDVEVFPLKGVGHFAPWQAPERVAEALRPFLAGN